MIGRLSYPNPARIVTKSLTTLSTFHKWRFLKDNLARYLVSVGGIGVIAAITLIFFYLLYVVVPMFKGTGLEPVASWSTSGTGRTVHLAMEEQAEIGARFTDNGRIEFFGTIDGTVIDAGLLPLPRGARVTAIGAGDPGRAVYTLGLSNGAAIVVKLRYRVTFPDNKRLITPEVEYPLGRTTTPILPAGRAILHINGQLDDDGATIVATGADSRLIMVNFAKESSLLEETETWTRNRYRLGGTGEAVMRILVGPDRRRLFVAHANSVVSFYDITNREEARLLESIGITEQGARLTTLEFLAGSLSLLAGFDNGAIAQWLPVRDANNAYHLTRIRGFHNQHARITAIAPEYFRKGFLAADSSGQVGVYHTTAQRNLAVMQGASSEIRLAAIAPRANAMLVASDKGDIGYWRLHNEHPEVSWHSLWEKVWYEGYDKPQYMWQSSSASNDFEPKFSLTPLAFGTLKAAFYAMLVAVPLAILGAIFTAYFMAPRMRQMVKPTIEIMEALPTVVLGFLAGLWLAPFLELHLLGVFALLLLMPLGVLLSAWVWTHLIPRDLRLRVPDGWQAALMLPVVVFFGWFSFAVSAPLELWLFGGDMRLWLAQSLGIDFDQRNAIVVGFAMGFAVIPTIFSIAEDAIFGVPRHLTTGSLALGATPWQTLTRVVLLTASPGIFSAIMIGLGRAVGETMIVLMATGNTAVMDMNIFQGMRTLSANIAVEMPESEVNSTHYRVLFLAGLVLFLFTFLVNTGAELIRQRLRRKYSSI